MNGAVPGAAGLSPAARREAWRAARGGHFDVVVIGGGITGAGCALDAASRGLTVLLADAGDLAGGTSSRSGKTAHGGLRYLEQFNFRLVAEALRERDRMIHDLAPHLVTAEPFLLPLTRRWERPYLGAGVLLYDAMAAWRRGSRGGGVPRHRHLTRRGALRLAPGLDADAVCGALRYHDGRLDDARYTLAVARSAAARGARILTYAEVTAIRTEGGRVRGVALRDTGWAGSGPPVTAEVTASVVINAAGVWAAEVQSLAGAASLAVRPAMGAHLLVEPEAFDSGAGLIGRAEDSVVILRRWFGRWLLGTTDTAYDGDRRRPVVRHTDVDYLLRNVNRYLARPLTRRDVLGAYAGLRPLLAPAGSTGPGAATSRLSRDHTVLTEPAGLVTVVGGKFTTYRLMARDAVDAAVRAVPFAGGVPPGATAGLPLTGAARWRETASRLPRLAAASGLPLAVLRRLLHRYGDELPALLELLAGDPELGRPLPGAGGYLPVEFRYAVTHEGARTLGDVLARRTQVAVEERDGGLRAAPEVARWLAPLLGWDRAEERRQLARYRQETARDQQALTEL